MRQQTVRKEPDRISEPDRPQRPSATLEDLRFRALLGETGWNALSPAVRRRFSKRLEGGASAIYTGTVTALHMSRIGWALAQALRLIGGPLPLSAETGLPSIVSVTEDRVSGGQIWTRHYARRRGFPQVIHSCKCFAGPTGLEEHLGAGFAMTLKVAVERQALVFRSAGYFWHLGRLRVALPRWLWPGELTVTHREIGCEIGLARFAFDLDLVHPRLGPLLHQSVAFEESLPWSQ
ncbi:MAG: DUF4166 domain-containing protein [Gemmatimonadales bacterium]